MDFSDYKPAPHVLERLKQVDFVAVVGPSAVGKTTLMTLASKLNPLLHMILTQTSRAPRASEVGGLDIHFRTKDEMQSRIATHEYVQVAPSLLGDLYATAPEDYPEQGIGMLAVLADALDGFRTLPFKSFKVVFIVPTSWFRWQEQLKIHGFEPDRLAKRLAEAKRSFLFAKQSQDVAFVINDEVSMAVTDLSAAALGEPFGPRLQADQARAREIIESILPKLSTL